MLVPATKAANLKSLLVRSPAGLVVDTRQAVMCVGNGIQKTNGAASSVKRVGSQKPPIPSLDASTAPT
jgi:hypothetical protein